MSGGAGNPVSPRPSPAGPLVSVIVPVFNRAPYIAATIRSLLAQTLTDFELVLIDDGSTDDSVAIVEAIDDPRLLLVRHDANRGIPTARNTGLDHARGRYIAWLDSDDLARPERLAEQVRFLDANPTIAMVGACAGKVGPNGARKRGVRVPPLAPADIAAWLLFRSPFQQSSIMGRGDVLRQHRYRPQFPVCEDIDMFMRVARSHRVQNMPRVLIDRRIHKDQSIRLHGDAVTDHSMTLLGERLAEVGMTFSDEDLRRHVFLGKPWAGDVPAGADTLDWADGWMCRLREVNRRTGHVDRQALELVTAFFWLLTCIDAATGIGRLKAAMRFVRSPLAAGLTGRHGQAWVSAALRLKLLSN